MPDAGVAEMSGPRVPEPAVVAAAPLPDELDEPPEPRLRASGFMKPFVVLALPGMYLFYKYNQYRREQRELSRRRVTERELQQLHHKIVSSRSLLFSISSMIFKLVWNEYILCKLKLAANIVRYCSLGNALFYFILFFIYILFISYIFFLCEERWICGVNIVTKWDIETEKNELTSLRSIG